MNRKDAEQTVQYVQSDQDLFLASANLVWYVSPVCVKGMYMKDAERTVQYIQSNQGLFVAGAICRGYENSAGPGLPMRTSTLIRDMKAYPHDRYAYSRTSMARIPLGPWKIARAMGSSSQ